MSAHELSKRIDDLHRRFDDLRTDQLQVHQEIGGFRQEVQTAHASLRQEMQAGQTALHDEMQTGFAQLRQETAQLRESQDRKFTLMIQVMTAGLTLLALLMTAYRFLRL